MASGVQVVLILALAFGVPLLFVLRDFRVSKRGLGGWHGPDKPPEPPLPPCPTGQESNRRPLPACLVPVVARGVPADDSSRHQRVLELV
jgi:hypothetical protein